MSRAVMQQALAYIEEVDYGPYDKWPVIIALKQALAEPEQEPDGISWLKRDSGYFTAPTPRKPLTDQEIDALDNLPSYPSDAEVIAFARRIEQAHGIK